jgi:hypothetical protein
MFRPTLLEVRGSGPIMLALHSLVWYGDKHAACVANLKVDKFAAVPPNMYHLCGA